MQQVPTSQSTKRDEMPENIIIITRCLSLKLADSETANS